jgi:pimeloyl-ACP methyl ester carboxylesterase
MTIADIIVGGPNTKAEPSEKMPPSREKVIRDGSVEIAAEAFGDPTNSCVLLIMGGMASMLWWPEEFCRRLAEQGRFVIRYDQRDSGLSTKYPPGRPGYGYDDAVDDVFRVLDGYRISAAHVAGFSQGGMVGQGAALKHPERVLSLTAISTSPIGVDWTSLPESGKAWLEHMNVDVDWSDRMEAVAYLVEDARLVASTAHAFDEAETKAFIERDFDRSGGYLSATNHSILFKIGNAWKGRLRAPLLVIHGTADPIFPIEHGVALAEAVDGSRLVRLEGGGHELHRNDWNEIIAAIAEHTNPHS